MSHIPNQLSSNKTNIYEQTSSANWSSATGVIPIPMTNDYLFRALLQRNRLVLKALTCALLHLQPETVHSIEILNPIELGSAINEKTFFLDIKLILNDYTVVNLEMQVINEHNWQDRSLSYLCRAFDHLNSGEEYHHVRPAVQIGLLDFTLFPENPEFYAVYKLMNIRNHAVYSDKFQLSVVDLTQIKLASDEDKTWQIDCWASLFKATTWEELKMLAKNNQAIDEAASTVYQLSQEERIRLECEAREDYYRRQRSVQSQIKELTAEKEQIKAEKKQLAVDYQNLLAWAKEHGYQEK